MADFSITGEVRLNSDPAEKSTSKWTVAAGQMIADFAKQASSKLAEVVKSGVDYNATMESYLTNFKVMLGNEEAAATKLSEIRKMAAATPFSLSDLTEGTQTLLQFGIAADDTTGVLQRLGDISLGNAEKLQTLTRAYGKMSSAQKVTLENVNMMIDAGFNPLNQICDATGESMSDLYKRISDGKVSFSELEAAVEAATSQGGQFYNGMLEASQTFSGRMSTLKDNVSNKRKNAKQWDSSHKDLEWDDDNGWVPKGTSSSGNGSSRAGSQTAANPYPAITSGAKKASKATKQAAAEVVKSISDTTTEIDGKITRTTENITETLSNGKTQQKQVITETSRQMVDGVLKDIKTVTSIAADGTKTVKQTMETVRETAKTVTSTFETLADGVKTTTQTVTETLTDGTETQKQVITEVYDDIVDGALVTIERVKTIAADGTVQVAEQIKKSSADTFDGLWKEIQTEADTGVLGTFDDLYTAVKNQDWLSIGKWVASTIYSGLTADQKKQVNDFALGIVTKLNKALRGARDQLVQGAIDLGGQIVNGLTGGFFEVWQQAQGLGSTLVSVFQGLQGPLSTAALAISQGLSGGLLSSFPTIFAGVATMVGTIGAAFEGMLTAISAALSATVFGIPMGLIVAAAAVALGVAIAAIVGSMGGSKKNVSHGGGSAGGGSSGSGGMGSVDITTGTGSLEDAINANTKALEKTNSALADMIRQAGALVLSDNMRLGSTVAASGTAQVVSAANSYHREGDTNITQNFYNGHDTAAAQQREARWEADKAKARKR